MSTLFLTKVLVKDPADNSKFKDGFVGDVNNFLLQKFQDKIGIQAEINELGYIARSLGATVDPITRIIDSNALGVTPGVGAIQLRQDALVKLKPLIETTYINSMNTSVLAGMSYKESSEFAYKAAYGQFCAEKARIDKQFPRDISKRVVKASSDRVKGDLSTLF